MCELDRTKRTHDGGWSRKYQVVVVDGGGGGGGDKSKKYQVVVVGGGEGALRRVRQLARRRKVEQSVRLETVQR